MRNGNGLKNQGGQGTARMPTVLIAIGVAIALYSVVQTTAWAWADKTARDERVEATSELPRASALSLYKLKKSPKDEWKLPKRLTEISGLASTEDGRLFAHNDERAIIFEIDGGDIVKRFQLGHNGLKGDFEGIAIAGKSFFLVTSQGTIFATTEGGAGEEVPYISYDSGIGDSCEVEGLDYEPHDHTLLLACKTTRGAQLENGLAIFRWSIEHHVLSPANPIWISEDQIGEHLPEKRFHASGIARHPATGTYLLVSAREHALLEVRPTGEIVAAETLKRDRHPHAEGISLTPGKDGTLDLVISDEGDDRRARLVRYRERSRKQR